MDGFLPSNSEITPIHKLPVEILHRIFSHTLLLSTLDIMSPPTPTKEIFAFDMMNSSAPHNILRVCRSWRDIVQSSASFWPVFSLSFVDPSNRTLKRAKSFIAEHLHRSQNLPLTCIVFFVGTFEETIARSIAVLVAEHQKRWRRVRLWIDVQVVTHHLLNAPLETGYDSDASVDGEDEGDFEVPVPVPQAHLVTPVPLLRLFTTDLCQLEELSINQAEEYLTSATSNILEPGLLRIPSLVRLTLKNSTKSYTFGTMAQSRSEHQRIQPHILL